MKNNYLIVHKSILPSYFDAVLEARNLIQNNNLSVSDACKSVGISRCTFYKYKDYIFIPKSDLGKNAVIALKLNNQKGILSNVLNFISSNSCNIITINQEMPISNTAFVTISLDILDMNLSMDEFLKSIEKIEGVKTVELIAIE